MIEQLPEPIASFIAAVNRHDEAAFLDAFSEQGVVDDWGREFVGRDRIKAWSEKEFIGSQGTLAVQKVESGNGQLTVIGDWRSNHANGLSKFIFVVDGNRLARMTIREG